MKTSDPVEQRNDEIEAGVTRLIQDAKAARAATSVMEGATRANRQRYEDQVARTLAIMEVDLSQARATLSSSDAVTSSDRPDTSHEVVGVTGRWLADLESVRTQSVRAIRQVATAMRHSIDGIYHSVD